MPLSIAATSSSSLVIDGKAAAQALRAKVGEAARRLEADGGPTPGLAVVIVGRDPASQVYVGSKGKAARELGFHSVQHDLPDTVSQADLLALVRLLNADPAIHGILVQLPLPKAIDEKTILEAIDPAKDVDGFHPVNAGLLAIGDRTRALVPCTPAGAMILLRDAARQLGRPLAGQNAVVVGRSNIVGKPVAQLLLQADCTVTIAHSRSRDLPALIQGADIVVAAVGRPEMIRGAWLKPGALVIDVGINRIAAPERGFDAAGQPRTRLVGDVAFAEAAGRAAAITPVPGGVGPMTIAMLMANTLTAASRISGRPDPQF